MTQGPFPVRSSLFLQLGELPFLGARQEPEQGRAHREPRGGAAPRPPAHPTHLLPNSAGQGLQRGRLAGRRRGNGRGLPGEPHRSLVHAGPQAPHFSHVPAGDPGPARGAHGRGPPEAGPALRGPGGNCDSSDRVPRTSGPRLRRRAGGAGSSSERAGPQRTPWQRGGAALLAPPLEKVRAACWNPGSQPLEDLEDEYGAE